MKVAKNTYYEKLDLSKPYIPGRKGEFRTLPMKHELMVNEPTVIDVPDFDK